MGQSVSKPQSPLKHKTLLLFRNRVSVISPYYPHTGLKGLGTFMWMAFLIGIQYHDFNSKYTMKKEPNGHDFIVGGILVMNQWLLYLLFKLAGLERLDGRFHLS
jgi:hypothetical protein